MKYYLIPLELAERLNVTGFRKGRAATGYVVTSGDIAVIGSEEAIRAGGREITATEAKTIISKL